jgi:hypothetical protein
VYLLINGRHSDGVAAPSGLPNPNFENQEFFCKKSGVYQENFFCKSGEKSVGFKLNFKSHSMVII